jgi:UPF0755 protein
MKNFFSTLLIFSLLLVLCGAYIMYEAIIVPNNFPEEKSTIVFINKGMNFDDVISALEAKRVFRSRFYFDIMMRFFPGENRVIVGKYSIPSGLSNRELLALLRTGGAIIPVVVTIPEGARITTQARIFRNNVGIDSARFASLAFSRTLISKLDIEAHSLEGYLFPSTYELMWQMNEEEIIAKQLEKFHSVFSEEKKMRAQKLGLTMHEVLTLASIVEGETRIDSERAIVAGVYLNRLKKNMPLQADPTIQYILEGKPRLLTYRDYRIESPFNTYRYYGLPPGPVNNPGEKSMQAVLYPRKHRNIFFVANGNGGHTFTANYMEHLEAVKRLRKILREREEQKRNEQEQRLHRDSSSFSEKGE